MIRRARTLSGVAIVAALSGAACATRGHLVAGIVVVALSVATACLAQRLHLRKETDR